MKRISNKMTVNIAGALVAVFCLIGINELAYDRSVAAMDELSTTELARSSLQRLLQDVLDAETGQRGYLLSDDPRYLEPYNAAIADIGHTQDILRELFVDKPEHLPTLGTLSRTVQQKLTEMDLSLRMKREGKEDAWKFVLTTDVGKEQMDTIRTSASQLIASSQKQRDQSYVDIRQSLIAARIGITIVAGIGFLAFWLYLRQSAALSLADQRQQVALQAERDLLGVQVRERTERLAELATHLQQVREDERAHLARELHDELGALLTAAKLDVARIKARLGADSADMQQRIQHLVDTLNSGIALKRRIIEDLRPSSLSNLGLLPSLEILTREFERRSGLIIASNLEAVVLDEPTQLTVYRLVQESLTNIAKYAQATHVNISLLNYPGHVVAKVQDDGQGFDTESIKNSSHGLAGMRHRVEASGGRLVIDSGPAGTTISAVLPTGSTGGLPDDPNFA
ncbi:MAG: CHASE3 domain-containing protein [Polaromonas sp.]|nr:CHASE3 domain-containing protein [Polaromonas sp.]